MNVMAKKLARMTIKFNKIIYYFIKFNKVL